MGLSNQPGQCSDFSLFNLYQKYYTTFNLICKQLDLFIINVDILPEESGLMKGTSFYFRNYRYFINSSTVKFVFLNIDLSVPLSITL
jgi:hypothetical protein